MILKSSLASKDDAAVSPGDLALAKWALGTILAGAVFHTATISLVLVILLKFAD